MLFLSAATGIGVSAQLPQPEGPPAAYSEQPNSPTAPSDRLQTKKWADRHRFILGEIAHTNPELVFLGDSITQNWEKAGETPETDFRSVWNRYYGKRHAMNMGVSGDTTGNVLWRIEHGELDGISPKLIVLLIGTNNTGRTRFWPAQETTTGIRSIVESIHRRLPAAKVLLLAILPKESTPEKLAADAEVNRSLQTTYANSDFVTFLDIGNVFIKDGKLDRSLFLDPQATPPKPALHPSAIGQERMAAAMEPIIADLLGETKPSKY
jgi:lysophospholipase L1-like esterase